MADPTDNAYPIWMENVSTSTDAGAPRAGRSRTDSTLATISDILGWRVDTNDTAGIRRALNEAFTICHDPAGKTVVKHKPRGFRVQVAQSGIAAVTGAQRSLYERARNIVDQVYPLLDGLLPLKADPDYEDISAIRALIRPELEELVEQLGAEGGPVVQRIDNALELLIDYDPDITEYTFADPQTVTGQLGLLRTRLGLLTANVNTIDEEMRLTNFHTLVNYIDMLKLTWHAQRDAFDRVASEAFLGTHSVLIERALTCVAESIREVYRAMDSVFIGAVERSTLTIKLGDDNAEILITVAELLDWIEDVATVRGFDIIRESGKDGVIHALAPTLVRLVEMLEGSIEYISSRGATTLPQALNSNRVMNALTELLSHLRNTTVFAGGIQRYPAPEIGTVVQATSGEDTILTINGNNFDQDADVFLETADREPVLPARIVWLDSSQMRATFKTAEIHGTWSLRIRNENGAEASTSITIAN